MKTFSLLVLLVVVSFVAPASSGQVSDGVVPTYLLSRVSSTGSKRFSEADIAKACGLKIGSRITAADLQQASDRLGQTGVFSQLSYKFDGTTALTAPPPYLKSRTQLSLYPRFLRTSFGSKTTISSCESTTLFHFSLAACQ
jgi:outer membrane protein assembly factor BamA